MNAVGTTVDISRRGTRVAGIEAWEQPGDIIGLRHGQEKARYQIMWIGRAETPQRGQMGLMCVDEGKVIWASALPQTRAAAATAGPDSGRLPISSAFAPARVEVHNRRREPRYPVEGGLHVREHGGLAGQWATVRDVSLGGCYVETASPLPLDAGVEAALHIADFQFQAHGLIVRVEPLTGMAIKFTDILPKHRARLEALIATLAQNSR